MKLPNQTSRPPKFTNAQTILYEIDMVRFAAESFGESSEKSGWRNLECFLLHFRNLIEFFGKPNPRPDDLSIHRPDVIWRDARVPTAEALNRLHREDLWTKYEIRNPEQVNDKISRYLQHCTEQRVDGKSWNVREMFDELEPLMSEFEKLLPETIRPWGQQAEKAARVILGPESYSTATPTKTVILMGPNPLK